MRRSAAKFFTAVLPLSSVDRLCKQYRETRKSFNELSKSLTQTLVASFDAAKQQEENNPAAALRNYQEIIDIISREGDIPMPANFFPELYTQAATIVVPMDQNKALEYVNEALKYMPGFKPALELQKGILMEQRKRIDDTFAPKNNP